MHYLGQLNHPERVPGFRPQKSQPIKFAILCSGACLFIIGALDLPFTYGRTTGFVSHREPHGHVYGIPENLPTLHSQSSLHIH
jgi:hypothetical protein